MEQSPWTINEQRNLLFAAQRRNQLQQSEPTTEGQCQCGKIRYRLNGTPLTYYVCHCRHCQLQSASAFGLSLWVYSNDFELLSGQLSFWTETADSGAKKKCAFCDQCGTRIYHGFDEEVFEEPGLEEHGSKKPGLDDEAAMLTIKTGTLDNVSSLQPIAHVWTSRALPWVLPATGNTRTYTEGPDSSDELFRLWQQSHQ